MCGRSFHIIREGHPYVHVLFHLPFSLLCIFFFEIDGSVFPWKELFFFVVYRMASWHVYDSWSGCVSVTAVILMLNVAPHSYNSLSSQ